MHEFYLLELDCTHLVLTNETNDYKRRRCENGKKQLNPVDNVGTIDTHPSKNTTKGGIAVAM